MTSSSMSSFAQHLDCIVSLGIDLLNQLSSIGAQLLIRIQIVPTRCLESTCKRTKSLGAEFRSRCVNLPLESNGRAAGWRDVKSEASVSRPILKRLERFERLEQLERIDL